MKAPQSFTKPLIYSVIHESFTNVINVIWKIYSDEEISILLLTQPLVSPTLYFTAILSLFRLKLSYFGSQDLGGFPWRSIKIYDNINDDRICHHWNISSLAPLLIQLPHGQNGCHFADDIFRCIFVNEKFCILIKISLKLLPKGAIDNNPPLVKTIA